MSSDGIFAIDNKISSHFESNSWISSFRRTTVKIGLHNSRQNNWLLWPWSTRRSGKRSVFLGGSGLLFELSFPPDWPFLEAGILDDSFQCWCNPRVEYLKVWTMSSSDRTRRFEIIHWLNHLHFFDPQNSFRRKSWTSTYLSLESYLPTSKCCWVREFVKMKIRNLQLSVCPMILWRSSLTGDEWISGWRSFLASLILNWCLVLTHHMRWCAFWYIRDPRIWPLRIRCWRRRRWICKNVSRYTMRVPNTWRPIVAARHSQRTA